MGKLPLRWTPAAAFGGLFAAGRPTCVVVHCTESDNTPAMAEALAGPGWFGGAKAGTSAHKVVDVDSICEGVQRTRIAYHAGPGGNVVGIAYEFCGRVSWSAAKWREPAQLQMLRNAAPHIADDLIAITGSRAAAVAACRWLSLAQLAAKAQGLCTHNDVRLALGGTTHSDPGPNFPYSELLAYVLAELTGTTVLEEFLMSLSDDEQRFVFNGMKRLITEFMGPDEKGVPALGGQTLQQHLADLPRKVWDAPVAGVNGMKDGKLTYGDVPARTRLGNVDTKTATETVSAIVAGAVTTALTAQPGGGTYTPAELQAAAEAGVAAALAAGVVTVRVDVAGRPA